jgi:hypothetical protein
MAFAILDDDNDFICPICCNILNEPIDCQKCQKSFCKSCVKEIKDNNKKNNIEDLCPLCKSKWELIENNAFNKILISALKFRCPNCKYCFKTQEEFDIHRIKCKKYKCKICHQEFEFEELIKHLLITHKQLVINKFNSFSKEKSKKYIQSVVPKSNYPIGQDYKNINYKEGEYINYWHVNNEIPFLNSELQIPNDVKLGKNNLYYCGKNTNLNCGCCDGICKEGNCLCINCMELNKQYKYLNPYYLINKKARAAKLDNGKFRCRYKYFCTECMNGNTMKKETQCKFPNNPCDACQVLNKLYKKYFNE